ncbi:MAG: LacI family DNA-binding transcriptional regulator [Bacteroidota bacterium]
MERHKKITVNNIARKLKLSLATVNYALNNLPGLQKNVKLQILKAAEELGYVHKSTVIVKQGKVVSETGFEQEPRDKEITMADIADLLHISTATVSRALNGSLLVGKLTAEKVLKAANNLGFVMNIDAKNLRTNSLKKAGDGEKKITIHDIAYYLDISASTVSRCYGDSGDVSPVTRARVLKVAGAMGFSCQEHARRLRTKNKAPMMLMPRPPLSA